MTARDTVPTMLPDEEYTRENLTGKIRIVPPHPRVCSPSFRSLMKSLILTRHDVQIYIYTTKHDTLIAPRPPRKITSQSVTLLITYVECGIDKLFRWMESTFDCTTCTGSSAASLICAYQTVILRRTTS